VRRSYLVATFSDPDKLVQAVGPVRRENFRIHDVFAPYPIHGLDVAMGIRRTRLPLATLICGLIGLATALVFQFYTQILDWPLNVGGKPDNSTLAFVPISFELTVLFGGLGTAAALLLRAKLFPGKREKLIAGGITNDTFALVVRKPAEPFDARRAYKLLEDSGATEVEEKEADL
jgi:hypothetical protein